MGRWNWVFGIVLMVAGAGCHSSSKPSHADDTALQSRRVYRMLLDNDQRLLGEDVVIQRGYTQRFETGFETMWARIVDLYRIMTGNTPLVSAVKMEDKNSADNRREGIFDLADRKFTRADPDKKYAKRWSMIAFGVADPSGRITIKPDPDYSVRAAAVRALNRSRSRQYTPQYTAALDDPSELVRLEAAKALANMPDDKAIVALIKHIGDQEDSKDVRIACADALRCYRRVDVARLLINMLNDRDFGVSYQSRKSLTLMTGKDFAYDSYAWLKYLAESAKPFLG